MASVGLRWLSEHFGLGSDIPFVQSFTDARRALAWPYSVHRVSRHYESDDPMDHLRFALKHEPLDQRAYNEILPHFEPHAIADWVRAQPLSRFAKMAWFLFEEHVGRIDLPDAPPTRSLPLLDARRHFTVPGRLNARTRILDNRLGNARLAPLLRRTEKLDRALGVRLRKAAREALQGWPDDLVTRALNYLYTKESKTSSLIEQVVLDQDREDRFMAALRQAPGLDLADPVELARMQREITERRAHATGWRKEEIYIGETTSQGGERIHCVFPPPDALPELMAAWAELERRIGGLDPVLRAAVISFAFVFIHPFQDGNGRMHRLLIHALLSRDGVVPDTMVLPVSASILQNRRRYDEALESFSRPLMARANYQWDTHKMAVVRNETPLALYRYFDATPLAEFLVDMLDDAVQSGLRDELTFLQAWDRAVTEFDRRFDLPTPRRTLLFRLLLQNGFKLAGRRRPDFGEFSDEEILVIEELVARAFSGTADGQDPLPFD